MKKLLPLMLSFVIAIAFVIVPQTEPAHAEYTKITKYKKNLTVSTVDPYVMLTFGNINTKKMSAKSSKKSVATVTAYDEGDVFIHPKKPGKTKLTFKTKKGETYICNLKVVKYSNAFKSFKIGKANRARLFKKDNWGFYHSSMSKAAKKKIKIVPKKNWKVKKITYEATHEQEIIDQDGYLIDTKIKSIKKRTIKNGSRITIQDKDWNNRIEVKMYNKKTRLTETYFLLF